MLSEEVLKGSVADGQNIGRRPLLQADAGPTLGLTGWRRVDFSRTSLGFPPWLGAQPTQLCVGSSLADQLLRCCVVPRTLERPSRRQLSFLLGSAAGVGLVCGKPGA